MKRWLIGIAVPLTALSLVVFQNCTGPKARHGHAEQSSFNPETNSGNNNGLPYDGKTYVETSADPCSDGQRERSIVDYPKGGLPRITKLNCAALPVPQILGTTEFSIDKENSDLLLTQSKTFASVAPAATYIKFVGSAQNAVIDATNNVRVAFSSVPAAGNLVVCSVLYSGLAAVGTSVVSIADANGAVWARAAGPVDGAGANVGQRAEVWYRENVGGAAGSGAITATFTAAFTGHKNLACVEYAGAATTSALENVAVRTGTGTAGAFTPVGSIGLQGPNRLVYASVWAPSDSFPGLGYIERSGLNGDTHMDKFTNVTGTADVTAQVSGDYISIIATFKAANPLTVPADAIAPIAALTGTVIQSNNAVNTPQVIGAPGVYWFSKPTVGSSVRFDCWAAGGGGGAGGGAGTVGGGGGGGGFSSRTVPINQLANLELMQIGAGGVGVAQNFITAPAGGPTGFGKTIAAAAGGGGSAIGIGGAGGAGGAGQTANGIAGVNNTGGTAGGPGGGTGGSNSAPGQAPGGGGGGSQGAGGGGANGNGAGVAGAGGEGRCTATILP